MHRVNLGVKPIEHSDRSMIDERDHRIHVFYRPEQVCAAESASNFSRSPLKPRLLLEFLTQHGLDGYFVRHDDWPPFDRKEFLLAHSAEYVDAFFAGRARCANPMASNGRPNLPTACGTPTPVCIGRSNTPWPIPTGSRLVRRAAFIMPAPRAAAASARSAAR